ncbi:MAG: hypothetical protein JXA46_04145 [Dehalococcoidales bacterium]|nr:hypothetical protein [Dehalococcoidales bacterium]
MKDRKIDMQGNTTSENKQTDLANDILKMLGERTENPGEAYVLLQQLSIFLWHNYKIDWSEHEGMQVAATRKQRCLDYISQMIDAFISGQPDEGPPASQGNEANVA